MKLITEDKVYVENKDLDFISNLPNYIIDEMMINNNVGFELFKSKESIDYFKTKEEIIDYNSIRLLEEEGIYDLIHLIYDECFKLEVQKYKSREVLSKIKNYEYMVKTLKEYIDYRKIIDKKFSRIRKGELEWLIKKKLLKKD